MKKADTKKLISLPQIVVDKLKEIAERERTNTKSYMEKVLIEHVKGKK